MTEIAERIKGLALHDKEALAAELGRQIRQERNYGFRWPLRSVKELEILVGDVMGVGCSASARARKMNQVTARCIIANALLRMGLTETEVGTAMGKNHATVHHLKDMMDTWEEFPSMYGEELNYWNQLKSEL